LIKGVIVPLITPLSADGGIDEKGLAQLVEYVIEGGVSAIFLLGSCGEFPALRTEEKIQVVKLTKRYAQGRVPILVGVGETKTRRAVILSEKIVEAGADTLVASAPFYYHYTQNELLSHFTTIARATEVPLLLYNIPQLVSHTLAPETVAHLADVENILGLKDSAGDMDVFQSYLNVKRDHPNFGVYQGAEPVAAVSLVRGADGVVLGLANLAPKLCASLYTTAKEGNLFALWDLHDKLIQLRVVQNHKSWLTGLKTAVSLLGICGPMVSAPFEPLTTAQVASVRQTMEKTGLFQEEGLYKEQGKMNPN
jgi:4-hydroxy-tetrahydrodipicolinate synthase